MPIRDDLLKEISDRGIGCNVDLLSVPNFERQADYVRLSFAPNGSDRIYSQTELDIFRDGLQRSLEQYNQALALTLIANSNRSAEDENTALEDILKQLPDRADHLSLQNVFELFRTWRLKPSSDAASDTRSTEVKIEHFLLTQAARAAARFWMYCDIRQLYGTAGPDGSNETLPNSVPSDFLGEVVEEGLTVIQRHQHFYVLVEQALAKLFVQQDRIAALRLMDEYPAMEMYFGVFMEPFSPVHRLKSGIGKEGFYEMSFRLWGLVDEVTDDALVNEIAFPCPETVMPIMVVGVGEANELDTTAIKGAVLRYINNVNYETLEGRMLRFKHRRDRLDPLSELDTIRAQPLSTLVDNLA